VHLWKILTDIVAGAARSRPLDVDRGRDKGISRTTQLTVPESSLTASGGCALEDS